MENTRITKLVTTVASLMCAGALFAGNTCTWQGGSGKFSDENWDVAPVSGNGDTICFDTTDGVAITVENDIADDFTVEKVEFAEKDTTNGNCGKLTLTGKSLTVRSPNTTIVWGNGTSTSANIRSPEVEVNVPIRFVNNCVVCVSRDLAFNRKVTLSGDYFYLRWSGSKNPVPFPANDKPTIDFMDEVYGPNTEIRNEAGKGGIGSIITYHGKVTAKVFGICDQVYGLMAVHLAHSENSIGDINQRYAVLYLDSSPCLGTNTVIALRDDDANAMIHVTSGDAVCDRVTCAKPTLHQIVDDKNASGKLTMRASADGASGVKFTQTVSLVWDPQGDYTYTLTDSDSTTTGSLEIKGGTFKLSGSTSFSALSEVIIRSGATLDLSASSLTAPFTVAKLNVDDGGTVVVPAGGVTFSSGFYRGIPLSADGYSSGWVSGGTVTISNSSLEPGVSYWKTPTSGNWNEAANWMPEGVPDADDEARITVQGAADYAVSFAGTETKPAKIVVGTDRTAKATLSISGEANFTKDTRIEVKRGGEITVLAGGRFIYDMDGATKHDPLIRITDGRFAVAGGYAMVTNTYGTVVASGADAEILVSGGELVLADKDNGANYGLSIKEGATLRMTGGTISIPASFYNSYLNQAVDGVCDFSGGTLFLSGISQQNRIRFSGDVSFSDSVVWTNRGTVMATICPATVDGSMTFSLEDNATMMGTEPGFVFVGGMGDTTFSMDSAGMVKGTQGNVGIAKGTALYRQTAGYSEFSWRGLCVGMTKPRDPSAGSDVSDNAVTGTVEIAGGAVCVSGETTGRNDWAYSTDGMFPPGTVLGYGGTVDPPASGRPYAGRMTISGSGSLTNRYGHLLVGVAPYGEGSLVLDGGTLRSTCERSSGQADYREIVACAVGVGGGKGEFLIRGGDCAISNNVWIGGVATNALRVSGNAYIKAYPYETHGGEGLLEVSGGSVAFGRDLVIGAEGVGVVSVVGSSASQFVVGRDLVLSNEAAIVVGGAETATLKFKADANGITPINVTGKFVVADKARLEVDLADFDMASAKSLRLLTCLSREGDFDAERVVLTGCQPSDFDVHVTNSGIFVSEHKGTIMIVF